MIALFPGRMNPPHLGHIITLLKIKDDYDKIIVALTNENYNGKKINVISMDEKIFILNEVLKHFPKFEIVSYNEPFRTRTNFCEFPKFDVVLTGNKGVYDNVIKQGLKAIFVDRTPIYRGEYIIEAYLKGIRRDESNIK